MSENEAQDKVELKNSKMTKSKFEEGKLSQKNVFYIAETYQPEKDNTRIKSPEIAEPLQEKSEKNSESQNNYVPETKTPDEKKGSPKPIKSGLSGNIEDQLPAHDSPSYSERVKSSNFDESKLDSNTYLSFASQPNERNLKDRSSTQKKLNIKLEKAILYSGNQPTKQLKRSYCVAFTTASLKPITFSQTSLDRIQSLLENENDSEPNSQKRHRVKSNSFCGGTRIFQKEDLNKSTDFSWVLKEVDDNNAGPHPKEIWNQSWNFKDQLLQNEKENNDPEIETKLMTGNLKPIIIDKKKLRIIEQIFEEDLVAENPKKKVLSQKSVSSFKNKNSQNLRIASIKNLNAAAELLGD